MGVVSETIRDSSGMSERSILWELDRRHCPHPVSAIMILLLGAASGNGFSLIPLGCVLWGRAAAQMDTTQPSQHRGRGVKAKFSKQDCQSVCLFTLSGNVGSATRSHKDFIPSVPR